jgi:DNA-binding NtrC family response regulator
LKKLSNGSEPKTISPEAISKLMSYDWPGNVRELANVVHSLLILSKHDVIDEKVFPSWTMNGCGASKDALPIGPTPLAGEKLVLKEYLANAEKTCIVNAIAACKGDKTMAARMLQIGRTTLYSKIKELGICET